MKKSWAVIFEENAEKYLVLIPKNSQENTIKKAYDFLSYLPVNLVSNTHITYLESLNIKVLNTLCFTKESTHFRKDIGKELYTKYPQFVEKKEFQKQDKIFTVYNLKMKHELSTSSLLTFYKKILQLESIKKHIFIDNFSNFEECIQNDFQSLEELETELKKVCYTIQTC